MTEVIETEKWKIFFKKSVDRPLDESYVELIFRLKSDLRSVSQISKEDLEELEKDIGNLGKWRKFKELKNDLEK